MQNNENIITIIYMPLLGEGTLVVRPVNATKISHDVYLVLPLENTKTERWEFPPGSVVRCIKETWNNNEILIAREFLHSKENKP